ncbi:MAG TPA: chemotaxis protein CheW [Bryobacteraceae bacterium]|nr:chemotaxis protein CheW [Bryobacteraceae bacterium]
MSSTAVIQTEQAKRASAQAGKYLVFQLAQEEFAIGVLSVREIIRTQDITRVPHTPPHMKGVINLRGKVIPVMDLRTKLGFPETEYDQRTCVIIVEIQTESHTSLFMGLIVDGVAEVLNLGQGDIQDVPDFGSSAPSPYLLGVAKTKGKIRILLDISKVLASHEVNGLQDILEAAAEPSRRADSVLA